MKESICSNKVYPVVKERGNNNSKEVLMLCASLDCLVRNPREDRQSVEEHTCTKEHTPDSNSAICSVSTLLAAFPSVSTPLI